LLGVLPAHRDRLPTDGESLSPRDRARERRVRIARMLAVLLALSGVFATSGGRDR
jgi:hypothetical protein